MKKHPECRKCGARYAAPSHIAGVCWGCANKPTRPAAKPVGSSTIDLAEPQGGHTCPSCGVEYANPFPAEICWSCEARQRAELERRIRFRRASGVSKRHAKFLSWSDLVGPPSYSQEVQKVRRFVETGDGVQAMIGERGLGKTQALSVAVWQTIEAGQSARLTTAMALLGDLKRRFSGDGGADGEWLQEWARPHLLCIDEIAEIVGGEHVRSMLTTLIDERYAACKPTILAGNVELAELAEALGDSVASRCNEGGGAVVFEGWPSFRARPAEQPEPCTIKFTRGA